VRVKKLPFALLLLLMTVAGPAAASEQPHVLIVTLPGITWHDIATTRTPALHRLIDGGAVASLATRTAVGRPSPDRGYLTLGAGDRAFLGPTTKRPEPYAPDPLAQAAYMAGDRVEGGTAGEALRRRVGDSPAGDVAYLGIAYLQSRQSDGLYDAKIGALGDALARTHVERGVVSAADVAPDGDPSTFRRSAVAAIVDSKGTVDAGALHGLVRDDPSAPFGVRTDTARFAHAVNEALGRARVVVAEPGETLRADEFAASTAPDAVTRMRHAALERADAIVGTIVAALPPDTTLIVLSPSPPSYRLAPDHLTPIIETGPGVARGWLTSPTTRRPGQVTLTDVAPSVLSMFGMKTPAGMIGRPMRSLSEAGSDRIASMDRTDDASVFRERFAALVFWVIATIISLLAIAAAIVFWRRYAPAYRYLVAAAYFGLAFFPAAHVLRMLDYWRLGQIGAHVVLVLLAAVLALAASRLPGPRFSGAVALLLLSAVMLATDSGAAGPLQVNGVWGHSPVVAGRFYGISNVGSTILYCAAIVGLIGLAELRGARVAPWWIAVALGAVVIVDGLAQFGADFGGLLTGVVAAAVVLRLGRGRRVTWRWVATVCVAAVALTAAATILDLLRAPQAQTHLGRFAETVRTGGPGALGLIVRRKAASQFGSLSTTKWTYFLPFGMAALAYVIAATPGIVRDALGERPLLRAALWGVVVVGVVGFAVNDSGISITAVALAHAAPVIVLAVVDAAAPRKLT